MSAGLADTQRRLWRLIAWPEGVRAGLREEAPGTAPLESLVRSDERLSAADRLDVYANAYFQRIHDVLTEDFPALAQGLGEDDFHDLATSYLAVCPSEHPSLRFIGARLPGFLEEHPAAEGLRGRFPWAADLARFEAACEDVFDAAEQPPATREALAAVAPEAWDGLRVRLRPCVRVLRLRFPVQRLRSAVREERPLPELAVEATDLCVFRRDERVVHRELDPLEADALERAAQGIAFGALCAAVAQRTGEDEAPVRAAAWLADWVADGLLEAP